MRKTINFFVFLTYDIVTTENVQYFCEITLRKIYTYQMKKVGLSILAAAAIIFASCGGNSTNTNVSASQEVAAHNGDSYGVDLGTSKVSFKATHKGGFAPRWGTISLSSGEFSVADGNIVAGEFVIDMSTISVDTASVTEADKKASDLENHLKTPDFFNVEKYPSADFKITSVTDLDATAVEGAVEGANKTVSGNLTLLDSTLNVSFPAKITIEGDNATVNGTFIVDRTAWGIKFGATAADPAEWGISKDIEIGVNVSGSKK